MSGDRHGGREPGMAERILDTAEELVGARGFNGFSYADVALRLDVTKANLHYHFGTKARLGAALVARYTRHFLAALDGIAAADPDAPARLAAYTRLYDDVFIGGRLCLCGMLAAEYRTLPDELRAAVREFYDRNEEWLVAVLEEGVAAGELELHGSLPDAARAIVSGLEGAMLVARPYADSARFRGAADAIVLAVTRTSRPGAGAAAR